MVCCCHCCLGLLLEECQEGQRAAAPPIAWLQDAEACLLNHSSPLVPAFPLLFKHTHRKPHPSQGSEACACSGVLCDCAACFKAPVHRKTSHCVQLDASWVSLKKVLTRVFSYKQKPEEQLPWSSLIYTGWQGVLEIDFLPSYRIHWVFLPFLFSS